MHVTSLRYLGGLLTKVTPIGNLRHGDRDKRYKAMVSLFFESQRWFGVCPGPSSKLFKKNIYIYIYTDTNVDTIEQKYYICFSIIHNSYIKSGKAKAPGQRSFSAASSFTQHRIHAAHCHVQISTVEEPYPDRQQCVCWKIWNEIETG